MRRHARHSNKVEAEQQVATLQGWLPNSVALMPSSAARTTDAARAAAPNKACSRTRTPNQVAQYLCLCRRSDEWFGCSRRWLRADIGRFGTAGSRRYASLGKEGCRCSSEERGFTGHHQTAFEERGQSAECSGVRSGKRAVPSFGSAPGRAVSCQVLTRCTIAQGMHTAVVFRWDLRVCLRVAWLHSFRTRPRSVIYVPQVRSWDV